MTERLNADAVRAKPKSKITYAGKDWCPACRFKLPGHARDCPRAPHSDGDAS